MQVVGNMANDMAANTDFASAHKVVGVLGGGQLGRMMARAAHDMGIKLIALDPLENSPAGQICHKQIVGDFKEADKIHELAKHCDVLTVEIEHVNADAMFEVQSASGIPVHPSPATVKLIQDKYNQKVHLSKFGIPVADYVACQDAVAVRAAGEKFGYPLMLKSRTMAYDGRGNAVVKAPADVESAIQSLVSKDLYAEKWFPFTKELAVMVVRALDGHVRSYPVVETVQKDNICHTVIAPAQVSGSIQAKARAMAESAVATFDGAGIYGVELFMDASGEVVVNEIAPRPHNSGHYSIEACYTSQFENHVRAVLGLPLGSCDMKVGAALMVNILGQGTSLEETWAPFARAMTVDGASLHWYGKDSVKSGRKMGHITFTGASMEEVLSRAASIDLVPHPTPKDYAPAVGVIMGSDSDLPTMKTAAKILEQFGVPFELTIVSAHRTPARLFEYAKSARARGLKVIIAAAGGAAHLPGMAAAITCLPVIGVPIPLSYLDGQDSLYSICQMPRGIPVATVAIGNSTNAALLAIRMLGTTYPHLLDRMEKYMRDMEDEVHAKINKLDEVGWEAYGSK